MNARGAASVGPRNIIILTGSTQGIAIVAQSLAEPGDEIVVESPSYPGALQVFQINGLRAIPVPVDDDGMRVDHVEAILRTRRPRFIYTMPSLHNPTNATMNTDRRERLATIARRAGVPIVEDDPYGPLAPSGPPLVALAPDHVVYLSTFSKTIAPSLRVGWLAAPRNDSRTTLVAQTSLRHGDEPLRAGRGLRLSRARLRRRTSTSCAKSCSIDARSPIARSPSTGPLR